jgi:predicted Zn-dependent peptidase
MDLARETYYRGHPLGNRVLGTVESIRALERDQMAAYFRRRYAANNLSLVLTGNYDWDGAVEQVRGLTAAWEAADAPRALSEPQPMPAAKTERIEKFNRAHLTFVAPGVSAQDPRRHAAEIVAEVIGAPEGSRLYWALVDPGLAETAVMYHSEEDGAGAFYTYVSCSPERCQEVADMVRQVWRAAMSEGLTQQELERAQRKLAAGTVIRGETPFGRLVHVGFDWQYRHELEPIDRTVDALLGVNLADANALLAERAFDRATFVALGPIQALQ